MTIVNFMLKKAKIFFVKKILNQDEDILKKLNVKHSFTDLQFNGIRVCPVIELYYNCNILCYNNFVYITIENIICLLYNVII